MKLQFDANQPFQRAAIDAVVDLFAGQPMGAPDYSVIKLAAPDGLWAGHEGAELGAGNQLLIGSDRLHANLRAIQLRNDIDVDDPAAEVEGWTLFDPPAGGDRHCPHFSVEMETGTGKTYVYLRTIFELAQKYGFRKFIIVVPSVAIREGVMHSIETMSEHLSALYNNLPFEPSLYDARRVNRLRQFATSTTLQLLVINIDAFRKNFAGTDAEKKGNVIYKEMERSMGGRAPIEFVQAARPIVIIDEPQSVDATDRAQEAIKALNPLCTLRYSATHRNPYNVVYRLDPVRAFELKLVKQIVVASAAAEGAANDPFVRVEKVDYKPGIKAKLRIHVQGADGAREKSVTVRQGSDLFKLSNERAQYAQGWEVGEINAEPGQETLTFANGRVLRLGEETGGMRDDVWRAQIKHTIRKHLEKELQLQGRGIKVLSLFFIDRVANYRDYGADGQPVPGKFARAFEEELGAFAADARFAGLDGLRHPVDRLHNGYFAQDRKGVLKDTGGNTQADDDVYTLIMKNKEALLALDEPLRFLFSHSALREGWDNPNVFQICTLNESRSTVKKRQEIGRGLRLPVDQHGARVFDESVNKLYVMANESYEDFAKALQNEYEDDCGVTFGKVPLTALARLERVVDGAPTPIGRVLAEVLRAALVSSGMLSADGRITEAFDPRRAGFTLGLPPQFVDLSPSVADLLAEYQIERHIRRERDERTNRLKKEVTLSPEFVQLWERIKPRTTYRVEFATDELVRRAVDEVRRMARVERPTIKVAAGAMQMGRGGIVARAVSVVGEHASAGDGGLPDVLAFLQNETELTRGTLAKILAESGRLGELRENPQRFLDQVASILKSVLHRLLVDGIKYERVPLTADGAEWEMLQFKSDELVDYLSALAVNNSVYPYVVCDSLIEREFARKLDERTDIKLFVKLPAWFKIDTPAGEYNPDWAIVKVADETLYLVRETKATHDTWKLRASEADKVHCGERHFEALGVSFAVATLADEV